MCVRKSGSWCYSRTMHGILAKFYSIGKVFQVTKAAAVFKTWQLLPASLSLKLLNHEEVCGTARHLVSQNFAKQSTKCHFQLFPCHSSRRGYFLMIEDRQLMTIISITRREIQKSFWSEVGLTLEETTTAFSGVERKGWRRQPLMACN